MSVILQARSGIARSGAERSNYYSYYKTVVLINGVDVSPYVQNLALTQIINDNPDQATFTLKPSVVAVLTPHANQIVTVGLGQAKNYEFAGSILRRARRYVRGVTDGTSSAPMRPFFDIECIDYTRLFNRRVVDQHWINVSASQIAADIVDGWTSGFTRAGVAQNLPTIDDFVSIDETPTQALTRLVNLIDGGFRIDAWRDLKLWGVAGDTTPKAGTNPRTLTISPVLASLKGGQDNTFTYEDDASQQRTRSIVNGMSTTTPIGTPGSIPSTTVTASAPVDWLAAGGGGSGGGLRGGGGGGGRVLTGTDTITAGSYLVNIGNGGSASNGGDTTFNGHTATGGGKGGDAGSAGSNGGNGGGGGGGSNSTPAGGTGTHNGGAGGNAVPAEVGGGGGGGAEGGNGSPGTFDIGTDRRAGGSGADGLTSSISGSPVTYGGGGGGNGDSASGAGGAGGGGQGGAGGNPSAAGTDGLGGGAGGGESKNGGKGVAILSYVTGTLSATGGTITHVGGRTIHTFTSNDTFVVSNTTVGSTPTPVTDLPIEDRTKLDAGGGFVLAGSTVVAYTSTTGPTVNPGSSPPGTTLSADANIGDTSLHVADASIFTTSPGWVKVGDQTVRYSGTGAGLLTGIPATGSYGALTASVKSGTTVTWIGTLVLSTSTLFSPALNAGDSITQRVIVDDVAAEAETAALEGGDGVHEAVVSNSNLTVLGATNRANAELQDFSEPLPTATWTTVDLNARPGRQQAIAIDDIAVTLVITRSEVSFPVPNGLPWRRCEGSTVHTAALLDAVVTSTD